MTVDVSGSQTYGSSSPIFSYTDEPPSGLTVSGTLTCTTVDGGTPIGASLDADSYTLDGSSCSGLSLSGTDSSAYSISYTGVTDGFTVGQASQSISFSAPASGTVGGQATLSATGGASGNPVVFSLDTTSGAGVCGVSGTNGTTVDYTAPGSCVIDANQEGNTDYSAALEVEGTVLVVAAPVVTAPLSSQTISFTAPASGTVGSSVTLSATGGGSGNPVVFSTDASSGAGVCRVSGTDGTTLSYSAVGDCVVDANQAGNAYYFSAPQLTETIVVVAAPKAGQTIKFAAPGQASFSGPAAADRARIGFLRPGRQLFHVHAIGVYRQAGPRRGRSDPAQARDLHSGGQPGGQRFLRTGTPGEPQLHGVQGGPDDQVRAAAQPGPGRLDDLRKRQCLLGVEGELHHDDAFGVHLGADQGWGQAHPAPGG